MRKRESAVPACSARALARVLVRDGLVRAEHIVGCTAQEIAEVVESQGSALPAEYSAFLATMGRAAGDMFAGTDCLYPEVLKLREWAIELLDEDGEGFRLPDDAIVFSMHQGYTFLYIRTSEGDDPPVYLYREFHSPATRECERFSEWLELAAERFREHR